jgi:PadR family transcriptional regulator PadR
MVVGETRDPLT